MAGVPMALHGRVGVDFGVHHLSGRAFIGAGLAVNLNALQPGPSIKARDFLWTKPAAVVQLCGLNHPDF
jgi:hypothetical protein